MMSIENKMGSMDDPKFSFSFVSLNEPLYGVNKVIHKEVLESTDIPVKIIKENKAAVSFYVFRNFSNALSSCCFPASLNYADIWSTFIKDDKTDK